MSANNVKRIRVAIALIIKTAKYLDPLAWLYKRGESSIETVIIMCTCIVVYVVDDQVMTARAHGFGRSARQAQLRLHARLAVAGPQQTFIITFWPSAMSCLESPPMYLFLYPHINFAHAFHPRFLWLKSTRSLIPTVSKLEAIKP